MTSRGKDQVQVSKVHKSDSLFLAVAGIDAPGANNDAARKSEQTVWRTSLQLVRRPSSLKERAGRTAAQRNGTRYFVMQKQCHLIEMKRDGGICSTRCKYRAWPSLSRLMSTINWNSINIEPKLEFGPLAIERCAMPSSRLVVVTPVYLGCSAAFEKPGFFFLGMHLEATPLHYFVNGVLKCSKTYGYDVSMQSHPHSCVGLIRLAQTHVNVVTGSGRCDPLAFNRLGLPQLLV